MYKISIEIHQITDSRKSRLKIQNHGLTDCLAKGVNILDGMKFIQITNLKKITFKNIQIHRLSDCLTKRVEILDGMKCSPLFAPIPLDTWKSEIPLSSGILIIMHVVLAVL